MNLLPQGTTRLWELVFRRGESEEEWPRRSTVRMSKSLPDSANPLAYEVLPPVINRLMNMHKDGNEIGQNNASQAVW